MEIILGKTAGFCYGVKTAVTNAEEKLKEYKNVSCLGELVHNGEVIKKLEKLGLSVVENIEDSKSKVIIRAHGISKDIYKKAKIHNIAEEYSKKGYYIFLIGGKKHPETIGTISFCGKNSCIIEKEEEIKEAIKKLEESKIKKLLIIVQTTFSLEKFNSFVEKIKNEISDDIKLEIKNTICSATKIRQEETANISKEVECMIIIGGKNSSNTKKLYDISKENCENTLIIETKNELNIDEIKKFKKIGIMAGASTPNDSIEDVIELIKSNE